MEEPVIEFHLDGRSGVSPYLQSAASAAASRSSSIFEPPIKGETLPSLVLSPDRLTGALPQGVAGLPRVQGVGRVLAEPALDRHCETARHHGGELPRAGLYMARMREILALEPGTAPPRPQAWAALRPHPQPDTATAVMRFNPPDPGRATVGHPAQADSASETDGGRITVSSVDTDDDPPLVHEVLGDLLYDVLGNLPQNVWSWSRSMLEDYATQLRVDRRIGRELNPDGTPTLVLEASSVRTPFFGAEPGFSGRAWVWASEENGHADVLSVGREVIARDRIRQNTLFTGIVTILRKENDFVEVRAATQAEAARVIDVERLRG
jgi:hypothetical protein